MHELVELPEAQKTRKSLVGYEDKSTHDGEHCGNCANFRPPDRCKSVKGPIARPAWCRRYKAKSDAKPATNFME